MRPITSFILVISTLIGSISFAASSAHASQMCLKANRLVDAPAIISDLETSSFNRLLLQPVLKKQKTQLLMRAQLKEKGEFWTYSQTIISSNSFAGNLSAQRVLHVFSSSNTSQIKWVKRFSLVKQGNRYLLYSRNKPTPYTFQLAALSECESIIF